MGKFIALRNAGNLDIVQAVNLLGASVKQEDSIGMFGSGIKYALAEAARKGIDIHFSSEGKVFSLMTSPTTFKGKEFEVVCLKSKTGKIHRTGITSDFGKEDWTDTWFIFREFYSNMLDELGEAVIVNKVSATSEGTVVYLPYEVFSSYWEKLSDYFRPRGSRISKGTGRIYKKGVYVGTMENLMLDCELPEVKITESRSLDEYSAENHIISSLYSCYNKEVWVGLFSSPRMKERYLSPNYSEKLELVIEDALVEMGGDNYILCPDREVKIAYAVEQGFSPVVINDNWDFSKFTNLRSFDTQFSLFNKIQLTEDEMANVVDCLATIEKIVSVPTLKYFKLVDAPSQSSFGFVRETNTVMLGNDLLTDRSKLLPALINVVTDAISRAGSYDEHRQVSYLSSLVANMLSY